MMEVIGSGRVRFGPYEVDLHTHELWKHGTRLKLVGQPFEILAVLVQRPGQLVTREELRTQLWPGDTFVDFNHGLNAAVNKLRDALCDSAEDPKYIETLPRRGYRFIAEVQHGRSPIEVERAQQDVGQLEATENTPPSPPATMTSPGSREENATKSDCAVVAQTPWARRSLRWLRYAVLVGALGLGLWQFSNLVHSWVRGGLEEQEKRSREGRGTSAFTPLTNLSDRTAQPSFSPDGSRVAFRRDSFVPGTSGIWAKQVGGEELVQLTNNDGDFGPTWSPDGRLVAFSRFSGAQRTIYEVPSGGGAVRPLGSISGDRIHSEMDWSPDGGKIAFVGRGPRGSSAIFLFSLEDQQARQITSPPKEEEDWGAAFSPEGDRLIFVRSHHLMAMGVEGGEVQRLTNLPSDAAAQVTGAPAWSGDGQSIVFASALGGTSALWRIPATGGTSTAVPATGAGVEHPAISRRGFRLACEVLSNARNIEQLDLFPAGQKPRDLIGTMRGENAAAQISPSGANLVFQSDRTGGMDLWLSDREGRNPVQVTSIGTAGSPRWSPDGKQVVFDVGLGRDWREPRALFIVDSEGRWSRPILQDDFSNNVPRWSHDGKWIYFASNRSGDWQIWKIRESGGGVVQMTHQGGFAAEESFDGKHLFYAKHNGSDPDIWRMPVEGGPEAPVFPGVRPVDWAAWTLVEDGILFVERGPNDVPTVSLYDFKTMGVRHLGVLEKPPFWLAASRDGHTILFDQPGEEQSHVMVLENFR